MIEVMALLLARFLLVEATEAPAPEEEVDDVGVLVGQSRPPLQVLPNVLDVGVRNVLTRLGVADHLLRLRDAHVICGDLFSIDLVELPEERTFEEALLEEKD